MGRPDQPSGCGWPTPGKTLFPDDRGFESRCVHGSGSLFAFVEAVFRPLPGQQLRAEPHAQSPTRCSRGAEPQGRAGAPAPAAARDAFP